MSYLADPPDNPIDIDGGIQYTYVIAQRGAQVISADLFSFTDFTYSIVFASPGLLFFTYTGATEAVPIYHTLALNIQLPEGTVRHEINVRILPTGSRRVPNITNAKSASVAPGAPFHINVLTDIAADSFTAENLPGTLGISTDGHITGTAPTTGSWNVITFVATLGAYHYKRYFVLIVGTGSPGGGGGGGGGGPAPGAEIYFDGDYTTAQPAGMPTFEIPFKTDPKPYAYKLPFWQLFENYSEPGFGGAGLYGGTFVGDVPGSIKSIGGGIIEFDREFALVPDTRSEYESFVYSYQLVLVGQEGGITEVPITVQSRVQFDYFLTDDPDTEIELPLAPRAIQILNTIYTLHDWLAVYNAPSGTEFLATDATYKCWKGNIYERQQRFVRSISINDIFEV